MDLDLARLLQSTPPDERVTLVLEWHDWHAPPPEGGKAERAARHLDSIIAVKKSVLARLGGDAAIEVQNFEALPHAAVTTDVSRWRGLVTANGTLAGHPEVQVRINTTFVRR